MENTITLKCKACGEVKPLERFKGKRITEKSGARKHGINVDGYGLSETCRSCRNAKINNRYHEDPLENALHRARVMNSRPRVRGMAKIDSRGFAHKLLNATCCAYCGHPNDGTIYFVLDHEMPLTLGGAHTLENLVAACEPCNGAKSGMHPDDYRAWLEGVRRRGTVTNRD